MASYLIVAQRGATRDGREWSSPELFELMIGEPCWELDGSHAMVGWIRPGDLLVFFLAGIEGQYLAGEGVVAGEPEDARLLNAADRRLPLRDVRRYPAAMAGTATLARLRFARESNVEGKYVNLLLEMSPVRPLTAEDVALIRAEADR